MTHASGARHDDPLMRMTQAQLIDEIRRKDRKRQYHYERFQHYRSRMTDIVRDSDNLIAWYMAFINDQNLGSIIPTGMRENINTFQRVLASELNCSVCNKPVGDNMRECLIPRCAHMIHTSHGGEASCYERLRANARASGSTFCCPVCGEELPLHAN